MKVASGTRIDKKNIKIESGCIFLNYIITFALQKNYSWQITQQPEKV